MFFVFICDFVEKGVLVCERFLLFSVLCISKLCVKLDEGVNRNFAVKYQYNKEDWKTKTSLICWIRIRKQKCQYITKYPITSVLEHFHT